MDIVRIVSNYFFHSDYNFIVDFETHKTEEGKKNILFLSGHDSPNKIRNLENYDIIFANFVEHDKFKNIHYIPLGLAKQFNNIESFSLIPIRDRNINMFYCGCAHRNRLLFYNNFVEISKHIDNCEIKITKQNNPQEHIIESNPSLFIKHIDYWEKLCNTKVHPICINAHSSTAHDNYRYFESIMTGTINILAEKSIRENLWTYDYPLNVFIDSWREFTPELVKNSIERLQDTNIEESILSYRQKLSKHAICSRIIDIIGSYEN